MVCCARPGTPSPVGRRFELRFEFANSQLEIALQKGLENTLLPLCFRYAFAGANHQAGFSPWRTIGWFNTMTTGKPTASIQLRTESVELGPVDHASCAEGNDSSLPRPTCDLRAGSGNSQANVVLRESVVDPSEAFE